MLAEKAWLACLGRGIERSGYTCLSRHESELLQIFRSSSVLLAVKKITFFILLQSTSSAIKCFFVFLFFHQTPSCSSTQQPWCKLAKASCLLLPLLLLGDEGKQSLNQSAMDFPHLVNMMAGSGFFQQWPGAMTFYNHPDNTF